MRSMHFQHGELGSRSLRKSSTDVTMILFLYPNPLLFPTQDLIFFLSTLVKPIIQNYEKGYIESKHKKNHLKKKKEEAESLANTLIHE